MLLMRQTMLRFTRNTTVAPVAPLYRRGRLELVLLLLLFAGAFSLVNHASAQTSHTTRLTGLDIVMSLDRTELVVGEPMALTISLVNTSPAPSVEVRANFQLPPGNGVEVNVQPPGELEYRYMGALEMGTYISVPLVLAKGKPRSVSVPLLYDRSQPSGLLFSKPGVYVIDARFRLSLQQNTAQMEAVLPPTRITVSEPTGDDAKVLEVLNRPEFIHAVHLSAAPTTDSLNAISQAARQYVKTELGALALKAEGMHYLRSERAEDRSRGADLLMKYLQNGVVYGDGDQVAWEVAAGHHKNKHYDLAREWVFWLMRNYPNSPRINENDALLYFYYIQPVRFTIADPWYLLKESWVVPGEEPPADLKPRPPVAPAQ
jgi:hypothetical protein